MTNVFLITGHSILLKRFYFNYATSHRLNYSTSHRLKFSLVTTWWEEKKTEGKRRKNKRQIGLIFIRYLQPLIEEGGEEIDYIFWMYEEGMYPSSFPLITRVQPPSSSSIMTSSSPAHTVSSLSLEPVQR